MDTAKTLPRIMECGAEGAVSNIAHVHGGGNISVCYDATAPMKYVNSLLRLLARAGFIITERKFSGRYDDGVADFFAPIDAIRLIVCIGGERFSDAAAAVARQKRIKSVYIPSTVSPHVGGSKERALFYYGGRFVTRDVAAFDLIIQDDELTREAGEKQKAEALGYLLASVLGLFEKIIDSMTDGNGFCDAEYKEALKRLREENATGEFLDLFGNPCESALYPALIYNYNHPETSEGEAAFIISYTLVKLYRRYLEKQTADLLVPKDYGLWSDALNKRCGADVVKLFGAFEPSEISDYRRRRHIVCEYREELCSLIALLDARLPALLKKFRRTYSDAGFFLKDGINGREILESISLGAPLCKEYTLIKHIDEAGFCFFDNKSAKAERGGNKNE
jgi:hypothetical protein